MSSGAPTRRCWDPLVRVTHWGVAAAVVANGLITEGGSLVHVWIGLAVAALLALRLIWGLVGPAEARFSAFPPSPRRAIAHVRDILAGRHVVHRSHNPLGALMVYALWATLAVAAGALSEVVAQRFREWGLTPAEADVAVFALKGCDVAEIAALRGSAAGTVRAQLARVYDKAGVNSRSALATLFLDDLMTAPLLKRDPS